MIDRFRRRTLTACALVAVAVGGVAGLINKVDDELDGTTGPVGVPTVSAVPAGTGSAAGLLAQLVVAEEDTGAHYVEKEWRGSGWAMHEGGCSTRELVLLAQASTDVTVGADCAPVCPREGDPCWTSPYDGVSTYDPHDLQIDHRVSLAEVARSRVGGTNPGGGAELGAARAWTDEEKRAFAEDMENLVAATGSVNAGKRDRDAGEWKPPLQADWCDFAIAYMTTKVKYGLSVDPAEHDGLAQMVATCES